MNTTIRIRSVRASIRLPALVLPPLGTYHSKRRSTRPSENDWRARLWRCSGRRNLLIPLAEAAKAHEQIASQHTRGKIVLKVADAPK